MFTRCYKDTGKNFAADIIVAADKISVKNKITGAEFIPTGKTLQSEQNVAGSRLLELELAPNSAKQPELTDEYDLRERNYLGSTMEKKWVLNWNFVDYFFERTTPVSYIIEHKPIGYNNKPEGYVLRSRINTKKNRFDFRFFLFSGFCYKS